MATQEQINATYVNDDDLGLPRGTTAKQVGIESKWNANALSPKGAEGFAQIMPKTRATLEQRMGRKLDPSNFNDALAMHKAVMAENIAHFGNVPDALRAYNAGWDKTKWDNPETNGYVDSMGYGPTGTPARKLTGIDKTKALSEGARAHREALAAQMAGDRTHLDLTQQYGDMRLEQAADTKSVAEMADQTHQAGVWESFKQSMSWDTITGRMVDVFQHEEQDPNFKLTPEHKAGLAENAPQVFGNDDLRDYVFGAQSQQEFERRTKWATERAEYLHRASNTTGAQAFANGTASLIAGMSDPVAWAATLGMGSVANTARSAYAVARATRALNTSRALSAAEVAALGVKQTGTVGKIALGTLDGAVGNMAAETAIRYMNDQHVSWPELFQQGLIGAAMGGAGGALLARADRKANAAAIANHASDTNMEVVQRNVNEVGMRNAPEHDGTYSTLVENEAGISRPALTQPSRVPREVESERVGYAVAPTLDNPHYRALHDSGVITELRTADDLVKVSDYHAQNAAAIPRDAKALYSPHEDRAYIFTERLSDAEKKNPTGVLMHEVGVHYGLERTVGTERFTRMLDTMAKSDDPRVREALAKVPADTPEHLRLEEALGYMAEKHPEASFMQKVVADVRNWLRENVPMFRNMRLAPDDILSYIRGSLVNSRNLGPNAVGMTAEGYRYSRNTEPPVRDDIRLGTHGEAYRKQIADWVEVRPEATEQMRKRAEWWYNFTKELPIYKQYRELFDSVGLQLALSKSKGVRMLASALAEDPTGLNRQHANSAAIDKVRLAQGWSRPVYEAHDRLLAQLLTPEEKVIWAQGPLGTASQKRVYREVHIERQKRRNAIRNGEQYVSTAHPAVREFANLLDNFMRSIGETGRKVGDQRSSEIMDIGYAGYMPYKWDWQAIHHAYNNDPATFNAFKGMLRDQYVSKVLNPTMDKFLERGPQLPDEISALRAETLERVDHLVDNYVGQVMRDPNSRTAGADEHFAKIASDILTEQWKGEKVTAKMAEEFKQNLGDIIKDRSRTEFDLLASDANGRMLLDFMDTDVNRMVQSMSSRHAGNIALTKKGIPDELHFTAMKDALRNDGATAKEIDHLDFIYRSLTDNLNAEEIPAGRLLQAGATMTMMGGLGFNAAADIASVVATSGMKGFVHTLGGMRFSADTPLLREMAEYAGSALGMDHRIHVYDLPASSVNPDSALAHGSTMNRLADAGVQATNYLSGMHHISKATHHGYLPVMIEDMLRAIHGEDGGLTPARLADTGIDPELAIKVKAQLDKHTPGRKKGDPLNLHKWDDQSVVDDFLGAVHRGAGQVLQRAYIGETPRWFSEGTIGRFLGQFKRFGVTASEKQAARNMFIADGNAASALAFSAAWGGALYYAKTEAKTIGMDDAQRRKYEKENLSGLRLTTGVLVMMNMSGMFPDAADLAATMFLGGSHAGSSPVAALGYLQNLGRAAGGVGHAAGSAIGLTDKPDYVKDFRNAWRIVPGSNTIFGAALVNEIAADD